MSLTVDSFSLPFEDPRMGLLKEFYQGQGISHREIVRHIAAHLHNCFFKPCLFLPRGVPGREGWIVLTGWPSVEGKLGQENPFEPSLLPTHRSTDDQRRGR